MGVFDKLKNVFFEEEYVEVEEPIKKPKKEKQTIAKKIDLPEMPKVHEDKSEREKEIEEEVAERVEKRGISERELRRERNESGFRFPMTFEDDDFTVDEKPIRKEQPVREREEVKQPSYQDVYGSKKGEEFHQQEKPYGDKPYGNSEYSHGLYEGSPSKQEPKVFRPTPIISPIYGILDKNYKKEEIVQKKEVRLTSALSSKNLDLDTVREKAYGDLASDITASMMDDVKEEKKEQKVEVEDVDNALYDLSDDDSPAVTNVTMGDAEEYFNDLGLEYNIDYKDHSREKATGRRSEKNKDKDTTIEEETPKKKAKVEDSLFDLIDSMYQDPEEEDK